MPAKPIIALQIFSRLNINVYWYVPVVYHKLAFSSICASSLARCIAVLRHLKFLSGLEFALYSGATRLKKAGIDKRAALTALPHLAAIHGYTQGIEFGV
jgi:hypothetical protein